MERGQPMLSQQQLLRLMPSPGGTDITGTDGLLTTMAIMERGQPMLSQQQLLRLMPSPGGTDLTGVAGLTGERKNHCATTKKGLQMPNPGGTETMDTTDTLPMAMATMERDLLKV